MSAVVEERKPAESDSHGAVPQAEEILRVENLKVHFPVRAGVLRRQVGSVKAVDGVSLSLQRGQTLGLVGESGCGKSTLGKAVMNLLNVQAGSEVRFQGQQIAGLGAGQMQPLRREMQMIFQDPAESLNSRFTVEQILREPLDIHRIGTAEYRQERVRELLERVSLPESVAKRYPHEFSGGQRQRIGIARAIALKPQLIVADEPVSALDVSVQSSVLNLLLDLQQEMGLSYLFIAHDLAVVRHVSDQVAVMYLGKIVELADADAIYQNPRHSYTKALLEAIPSPDPRLRKPRKLLAGDVPSPIDPPAGCAFGHRVGHPRYEESIGMDLSLKEVAPGHWVTSCPCCVEGF